MKLPSAGCCTGLARVAAVTGASEPACRRRVEKWQRDTRNVSCDRRTLPAARRVRCTHADARLQLGQLTRNNCSLRRCRAGRTRDVARPCGHCCSVLTSPAAAVGWWWL